MPICLGDRDRCVYLGSLYCYTCARRKPIERMTRREFRAWDDDPWSLDHEVARHDARERWTYIPV